MARYQLIIAFDGTDFSGYQRQAKSRTVQGVLEAALRRVGWHGSAILAAGRTDSGVHALGQVVAVDLDWSHSPQDLQNALNANLPPDVVVRQATPVDHGFHPRFDALARRYRYHIFSQSERDPFQGRYAWHVWPRPEASRLHQAAQFILGENDFRAFGRATRPGGSTFRNVYWSAWSGHGDSWVYEVVANSFLYRMVRHLVFVMVMVGQGWVSLDRMETFLTQPEEHLAQGLAPAQGLFLVEVYYDPQRLAGFIGVD